MVDGQVVELLAGASGLVWTTRQAGTYSMALVWRTGSASGGAGADGAALAMPLPRAASIRLRATLPGVGLGATVIPAQGDGPPGVQVNRVASSSGAVADWRVGDGEPGKPVELTVFLDCKLERRLLLEVDYDRSLPVVEIDPAAPQGEAPELELPLLEAIDGHRQRGMAVLLQGRELALRPLDDGGATRVGENQLIDAADPPARRFPTLRRAAD